MERIVEAALRTDADYTVVAERLKDHRTLRLLHAAAGLCTEAGEFMDILKRHIFYGKPIDEVNAEEELGDISWYQRIAIAGLEKRFDEMIERNIRKLRTRYPDKFTEDLASNRNLSEERKTLEARD